MRQELFVITPAEAGPDFADTLDAVLGAATVSAVLIQRGDRDDKAYGELARALIPAIQRHDAAALLDNAAKDVVKLGADGVHVTSGETDLKAAVKALKPDFIVGAGGIHSRHEALTFGELDIDYVFFGALDISDTEQDPFVFETGQWWAETCAIPSVCLAGENAWPETEFIACRESIWKAEAPGAALAGLAARADHKGAA